MPFRFKEPIKTEQGEFPLAAVSLVCSPAWRDDGVEANIILKLEPYRMEDGRVVRPTEHAVTVAEDGSTQMVEVPDDGFDKRVVIGAAYEEAADDADLGKAMQAISVALQEFILTVD